jgi:hypothetical protein
LIRYSKNMKYSAKSKKDEIISLLTHADNNTDPNQVDTFDDSEYPVEAPKLIREYATYGTSSKNVVNTPPPSPSSDDDIVEKNTVLLEEDGVKYWMDIEETGGIHDIYDYTTLDHIGFFNKMTNVITKIDE